MPERLKDIFFQRAFYEKLASAIKAAYPAFDTQKFLARIYDEGWEERALKELMRHTTISLDSLLPGDYRAALEVMRQAAPKVGHYSFENTIFPDFVEVYGLDDWEASLPALEEFTQLASAEFAVRPFILKDPQRMMAQMQAWAQHPNEHVRRLASEGSRPRLPWGMALPNLQADPTPILPILEALKLDESESVRRSVANNLNDISKDNAQVTLRVLRGWQEIDREEIRWITEHALRTLVKAGNVEALGLLGYSSDPQISVRKLIVEPRRIKIGGEVNISFEVESQTKKSQKLMIDYIVHLMRAKGKQTPKVFKLAKKTIAAGETLNLTKKQSFRPVTTRKYYPGDHAIEIQINGKSFGRKDFVVE